MAAEAAVTGDGTSFAALLRRHRVAAVLSQEALAERAGLSVRGISDLERGVKQRPHLETVRLLSDALGLAPPERAALTAAARPATTEAAPVAAPALPELRLGLTNLPIPPTALVGRDGEVAHVTALLRGGARVVTLTGPGGVGKTRLALQVGADLIDDFPHGIWFVDLGATGDPNRVAVETARALGVQDSGQRSLREHLVGYLQGRALLLVLDNFEQLLDAAPLVGGLAGSCPKLKILVTSRAPLRVAAEQEFPVPPLPVPHPKQLPPPDELERYPSVQLFVQRAKAIKPDFALAVGNASAVAQICGVLDGLPLAIELAASRIRVLPPQTLLKRLQSRLTLLTDGARDRPERHQTLRAAIAWSHDLLEPEVQALFARLSVFAGGCTFDAAEAVTNPDRALDVFLGIGQLVEHNLARQEEQDDEPRFGMLPTIREFASERLQERGEGEALGRAHAEFFKMLATRAEPELVGPGQVAWLRRLQAEHDNLRVALGWFEQTGDGESGLRLAATLWRYWLVRGHLSEGRTWLANAAYTDAVAPGTRANALVAAGRLALEQGDTHEAEACNERALALFRELGDVAGAARSLDGLGTVAQVRGDYAHASALLEEALQGYRTVADKWGIATVLNHRAMVAQYQGEYEQAEAISTECLRLFRELGDRQAVCNELTNLGALAFYLEDYHRAASRYEESLRVFRELGDSQGISLGLVNLGETRYRQGDLDGAEALYTEALSLCRELGNDSYTALALWLRGLLEQERGDDGRSYAFLRESLLLSRKIGDKLAIADCLVALAGVAATLGQPTLGARLLGSADALREEIGAPVPPAYLAMHERQRRLVETRLPGDASARASAVGRSMSIDDAVSAALGLIDQAQDPVVREALGNS
jgi:predicted ATPase/transcriptional regulator with XRE-family HTH domain